MSTKPSSTDGISRSATSDSLKSGKRAFTTNINRKNASAVREGLRFSTAEASPGQVTRATTISTPGELIGRKSTAPANGFDREKSQRNASTRARAIVGKTYEKRLEQRQPEINNDPLSDMLRIAPDDVQVHSYHREHRTVETPVPSEFSSQGAQIGHFAKQCVKFYTSPWHTFNRKVGHITKIRATPVCSDVGLPMPNYEVDLAGPRERRAKDKKGYGLDTDKVTTVTVGFHKVDAVNSGTRLRSGTATTGRRGGLMPNDSKWPRRAVQMRFETSSGPPILEIFRDPKAAKANDYKGDRVEHTLDITFAKPDPTGNRLGIELQGASWNFVFDDLKDDRSGEAACSAWVQKILTMQSQLSTARTEQRISMTKEETETPLTKPIVLKQADDDFKVEDQKSHEQQLAHISRKDLFGVYKGSSHLPRLHYDSYDVEPTRLDVQKSQGTINFVVTCNQLSMALKQRNKPQANVEPFFCSLALYDVRDETKISETFHFDLNNPSEGFEFPHEADVISKSREAQFSVEYPHDEIYLVLTVEKVLQGDVTSVAETYAKQGDKIALKQAVSARAGMERKLKIGGIALMPFVWAARQVFPNGSTLEMAKPFSGLYKQEPERLKDGDLVKVVADYHRFNIQQGKFKGVQVPGSFDCTFAHVNRDPQNTITHDLLYLKPQPDVDIPPRREVLPLPMPSKPVRRCHTSFSNFLYIWPQSVNFNNQKKASTHSKARNIMVRIQLLDSDVSPLDQPGLPFLFGKSSSQSICSSVTTSVCYHNKSPTFGSEFKVKIPANLTDKHHLFFTFYHIAVDDNSKKGKQAGEIPIGFAWLPLLEENGKDLEDGMQNLMVAHAGTTLTRGYVAVKALDTGQVAGPKIAWIDPSKPIFHLKTQRVSSVATADPNLRNFFELRGASKLRDEKMSNAIKALHAVEKKEIIANFPVIFNELFELMCAGPTSDEDNVSLNCVRFMVYAVDTIHKETRGTARNLLMRSYAYHVATSPVADGSGKLLFGELTKYLSRSMSDRLPLGQIGETVMKHGWFFFQIIAKTMAEFVHATSTLEVRGSRELRFSADFHNDLEGLILGIAIEMKAKVAKDLDMCKETNVSIASFLLDCLAVMDRGVVLVLLQKYLASIGEGHEKFNDFLTLCRIQFIEIICHYEHYIPINLPLVPASKDEAVGKSDIGYRRRHVLVGILLTLVKELMKHKSGPNRGHAITLLRSIIAKHDLDPRFIGQPARLARIALLYFPVVHMVMENWVRLHTVRIASKKNIKPTHGAFTESETQDLLISFMWVLKNISPEYLQHFFSGNNGASHMSRMLDVLTSCLATYQYLGREKIERRRESKVPTTDDVLRQFEFEYQPDASIGRRGSNASASGTYTPKKFRKQMSNSSDSDAPTSQTATLTNGRRGRLNRVFSDTLGGGGGHNESDTEALLQAHVSKEVALVVLKMINLFSDDFSDSIKMGEGQSARNPVTWKMSHLLTLFLATPANTAMEGQLAGQSEEVLLQYFRTLLRFVQSHPEIVFHPEEDYSQTLTVSLLNACNSELPFLRDRAGVMVYNMLKINFAAMASATTMAVSAVAGESRSDRNMRASLSSIADYVATEANPPTLTFINDVKTLMVRLGQVIRDTEHMQHYYDDAEMMVDLMYRVADSYSNTPQLRVIHLKKIAQKHFNQEKWAEAGMAICHCAAVIAEHLKGELRAPLDQGCAAFASISPNIAKETSQSEYKINNTTFSEQGIIVFLQHAVAMFEKAKLYELISRTYMLYFPLLEHRQNYKELAHISAKMQQSFLQITHCNENRNRFLGSYFRVGFFGSLFAELHDKEFVYKEPNVTRLAEFSLRLQTLYSSRFGGDNVVMVRDAKAVDKSTLDLTKAYIQITFVEPYDEAGDRKGYFQKNHDINQFVFETPFTKGGKAHGSAATQCRRKTIVYVEDNVSFPYVKKRLEVRRSQDLVLEPLDVAIEEMTVKVKSLRAIVDASPTNMVMLQMQLQGIVSLQVNAGPMEYATVFLRNGNDQAFESKSIEGLQKQFALMIVYLEKGVELNSGLISADQEEYHEDLKAKFLLMRENLQDALGEVGRQTLEGANREASEENVLDRISGLATPQHSIAPIDFMKAETSI